MEEPSNGGILYHEVQEGKLCAVHCVNTVLQGPFFSEFDLAALASDLDHKERQMMLEGVDGGGYMVGDFYYHDSHNVSLGGDFSIQVLQKALEVWDLQVIPHDSPAVASSKLNPDSENAFICHLLDHWFCIRKVNGEWYNFNSLYPAPEHLSKFYLSAYMDSLKGSGWSIFLVRGNFPKDCPILSSNGFGQWLTPDDAQRITKSCNQTSLPIQRPSSSHSMEFMEIAQAEEVELNAAIQASLMDSSFQFGSGIMEDVQAAENATEVISEFDGNIPLNQASPSMMKSHSGIMEDVQAAENATEVISEFDGNIPLNQASPSMMKPHSGDVGTHQETLPSSSTGNQPAKDDKKL